MMASPMVSAAPMAVSVAPMPAVPVPVIGSAIINAARGSIVIIVDIRTGAVIAAAIGGIIPAIIPVFRNAAGKRETRQSDDD